MRAPETPPVEPGMRAPETPPVEPGMRPPEQDPSHRPGAVTATPGKPRGNPTHIPEDASESTRRDLELENEAAQQVATGGRDVEQNPDATAPDASGFKPKEGKRPDYKIDGNYFDHYVPEPTTNAQNIATVMSSKAGKGQTERVVVNMQRNGTDLAELESWLNDPTTTQKLKEVIVLQPDGQQVHLVRGEDGQFRRR